MHQRRQAQLEQRGRTALVVQDETDERTASVWPTQVKQHELEHWISLTLDGA